MTQFLLPNHSLAPGSARRPYFGQTWVPIDDRSCWVYVYSWNPDRPLTDKENRYIPGVPSVHAEVDEHWVPIRNRGNDYLIDREAAEDHELHRHRGPVRAGRRHPGQPGLHRRPHARAPRPDRPRHRPVPAPDARRRPRAAARRRAAGGRRPQAYRVRSGGTVAPARSGGRRAHRPLRQRSRPGRRRCGPYSCRRNAAAGRVSEGSTGHFRRLAPETVTSTPIPAAEHEHRSNSPRRRGGAVSTQPNAPRSRAWSASRASIMASTLRAPDWKIAVALSAIHSKPMPASCSARRTTRSWSW